MGSEETLLQKGKAVLVVTVEGAVLWDLETEQAKGAGDGEQTDAPCSLWREVPANVWIPAQGN